MASCIIIDDEQHCIDLIKGHIADTDSLNLKETFLNPKLALNFLISNAVDIIFLDIDMPQMNGLDFIDAYKGKGKVILCTAYQQYAIQGFDKEVADYLLKPVTYERFMRGIQRAFSLMERVENVDKERPDFIFVKSEAKGKYIRVPFNEIDYIQGEKNYISFHNGNSKIMALLNLRDMIETLPRTQFIRVHNSYIVNFGKVEKVEGNNIILKNSKVEIPLGISYKDKVLEAMNIKARNFEV